MDFEKQSGLFLVDFYANWCNPCKMMHPIIDEISSTRSEVKVVKIDVDKEKKLTRKYGVMSIPTILIIKDGKVINKFVGMTSKDKLLDSLK